MSTASPAQPLHLKRGMARHRRASVTLIAVIAVVIIALAWYVRGLWAPPGIVAEAANEPKPLHEDTRVVSDAERRDALERAQVWQTPKVPINRADLSGGATSVIRDLACKFKLSKLGGTTPKFDCMLESGEEIRIKYGKGPEIPAEVAATRLLKALGFGADDVTLVERLQCYGCPAEPFSTMKAVEITRSAPLYSRVIDYGDVDDFTWVARERKFSARPIETKRLEGWAFFELDHVNHAKGGAPRAHVDALRLMAVLMAHWDNKAENQRLVCLAKDWRPNTPCPQPFLLLQDVGATFGPSKVNLEAWEKTSMWHDRATCAVSMRDLPYNGATFNEARVSEAGRKFLAGLLAQLSDRQVTDLFVGARFDQKRGVFTAIHPIADWIRVFKSKVHAIIDGPACPA